MKIKIDLQIIAASISIPSQQEFDTWINAVFENTAGGEICIRIIDEKESQWLNNHYRHKNYPTNILSFPYEKDETNLLGDLAICAPIIEKESIEYNIDLKEHWAHIIIHGCLHLIGYTHDDDKNAKKMESLEFELLKKVGFKPLC